MFPIGTASKVPIKLPVNFANFLPVIVTLFNDCSQSALIFSFLSVVKMMVICTKLITKPELKL